MTSVYLQYPKKITRSGLLIEFAPTLSCFVAQSKFVPRYRAAGESELSAVTNCAELMREPHLWREVANEHFAYSPLIQERIEASSEQNLANPGFIWVLLERAFREAYESPVDNDTITRIYSFAEWCMLQEEEDPESEGLYNGAYISLYESLPTIPEAVQDLPNHFDFAEIELLLFTNPWVMKNLAELNAIKAVFHRN